MVARRWRQHPPEFGRASTFVETAELPLLETLSALFLKRDRLLRPRRARVQARLRATGSSSCSTSTRAPGAITRSGRAPASTSRICSSPTSSGVPLEPRRARAGVRWIRLATDLPTGVARDRWVAVSTGAPTSARSCGSHRVRLQPRRSPASPGRARAPPLSCGHARLLSRASMLTPLLIGALLALLTVLPLAWKWQLGVARVTIVVGILAALAVRARRGARRRRRLERRPRGRPRLAAHPRARRRASRLSLLPRSRAARAGRRRRDPEPRRRGGHLRAGGARRDAAGVVEARSRLPAPGADEDPARDGRQHRRRDRAQLPRRPRQPRSDRRAGRRQAPLSRTVRIASAPRDGVRERARHPRPRARRAPDRGGDDRVATRAPDRDVRAGGRGAGARDSGSG